MNVSLLEKIGLTKGEVKVYLALNKLGESTVGVIAKESGVSKSKIYDILERLIAKGLAGYIIKENTKSFFANSPSAILDFISKEEKEIHDAKKEAEDLIPQLIMQRSTALKKRVAEIYEGFKGIKAIREELMLSFSPGDTLLVLGAPRIANEMWEGWFREFHKNRIKRRIGMKIIYNSDARDYGKTRQKMKITEVKYLPSDLVSPNWIDVFNEAVLFVMILAEPIAFVVRDKELARSFKAYFDIMWKQSKP